MTSQTNHLSREELTELLEETLPHNDQLRIEEHLRSCEYCRRRVSDQGAEPRWWHAVSAYLGDTGELRGAKSQASPELQEIATLLSPTDDPRMLGRIGGYEIAGIVGSGGMGIVLKGLDVSLNRYVAIKLLRPSQAPSVSSRLRFEREGRAVASIVHENVIAIHGVSEVNGIPFLVMPYLRGESLAASIARRGPFRLEEILRVGCQIAGGLAAAHAQGVIHRDVKPSNVLLENGLERLKLTDFGLARAVDDTELTKSGTLAGTPEYMSPEQVMGEVLDARSDLFSLGSVLWTLSTGRPPFVADSCYGVIRRIVECETTSVRQFDPALPLWWEYFVARLMRKCKGERFSSASEVEDLLRCCLAHQQDTKNPLPKELTRTRPSQRNRGRRLAWLVTIATVLLGAYYAATRNRDDVSDRQALGIDQHKWVHDTPLPPVTRWHDGTDETLGNLSERLKHLQRTP